MASPQASPFRREALEAMEQPPGRGALLALSPRWIRWSYRLILATLGAGAAFTCLARVGDHARGPAVVRVDGRLDLATPTGGLVTEVLVRAGEAVAAGETLVRLHGDSEQQELARLDRELELKLLRVLLYPADHTTRQSLAELRAARELAAARLRDRQVIAPRGGVVRNLRIRPGQHLAPGDVVLTLADEGHADAGHSVVALVPGQFRPLLRPGMPLRFALEGHPQVTTWLEVESVDDEVVGPAEVRRYLGRELGDTLPVEGSLVLVRARLPEATFALEGQRYRYYDGVPGRASVRVRSMRLVSLLFPPVRELFDLGG